MMPRGYSATIAPGRLLLKSVEERRRSGLERPDAYVDGLAGRHDLLDAEVLSSNSAAFVFCW